jgi:NADH-quinone oxidoreductase subunit M
MPLIILTTFTTVLVVLAGWEVIKDRPAQYMAAFLIMEGLMNGVFAALDAMLFYVFWEGMLIPMFLIIGVWGGPKRVYATIKFFLYTFLGSVFMLVALIYMYTQGGSFAILDFHVLKLGLTEQVLIFLAFLLAFAVKVPMWPVHTWLPDAHVEAPTGGSVILAAIMLKIGGYGFLRFSLPITPDASHELDWLIIFMSLTAVVYIGFVALVQQDMKKLIAYSSIAHMGFVTLGFFLVFTIMDNNAGNTSGAVMGMQGGMVQMVSHGFISGALFLCVGVLYDRMHSREIADYGGVVNTMPVFAAFMVLFAMSNAGLPGTSGFVGEFLVIIASFKANFWFAFLAATTLILGAAYSLWLVKRVVFGEVGNEQVAQLQDINGREALILGSLAAMVLLFGIWPAPLVEVMQATLENLVAHVTVSKL